MRLVLAMLTLATIVTAQDEKKKSIPASPIMPPQAIGAEEAATAFDTLRNTYTKAQNEFYAAWREARKKDPKAVYDRSKHPNKEFVSQFENLANRTAGTDSAVDAWVWFIRCGGDKQAASEVLLRDYIGSKKLVDAAYSYSRGEDNLATLDAIATKSPHRDVQGVAYLLKGQSLLRIGKAKEAGPILVMCQWKYSDVPLYRGRYTVGGKAASSLFEARNLTIGNVTPDIEGEDIDGVTFKLSDYRGKVILLDFWGDW